MLIYIKSIPERESAYGMDKWRNKSGVLLNKRKFGNCNTTLRALYSNRMGGLSNGISYKPWIDADGKPVKDEKGNTLTLQDKLEQKFNLPKDYLHNRPSKRGQKDNFSYFQTKSWALKEGVTVLDTDTLDGATGYYVMLDSKYVANSEKEWLEHKWPKAKFYIALENEEDEIKYAKTSIKSKSFAKLEDSALTPEIKRKMVAILELASTNATLTNQQIHNLLFEHIDKSSFRPGSNIEKFNNLVSEIGDAKGRKYFEAKYLLKRALDNRVIYEKSGSYTWVRPKGNIVIGDTYDEALEFLTNPKKVSLVDDLIEQIEKKN